MVELRYRGIAYTATQPMLELTESNILATYRGQHYHPRYPKHVSVPQPVAICKYRGVAYQTTATGGITAASASPQPKLVPLAAQIAQDDAMHRTHRRNLCDRLNQRLASAQARGDANLVALLEAESQELVCLR